MAVQIADALIQVNDESVAIMPNSFMYTEGLGEQTIRAASAGGGQVEQIYSNNIESNFSTIKFDIPATIENQALARSWKVNRNQNVVAATGSAPEGDFDRTFTQAAILGDYEVALGADTVISIEFKSNPAV
jgi:hypothetical protein